MTVTWEEALSLVEGTSIGLTHGDSVARSLAAQIAGALKPGALSSKDKLLLLMATCAARRRHQIAKQAAKLALKHGAREPEIDEILLACFASRGPLTYLEARAVFGDLLPARWSGEIAASVPTRDDDGDTLASFLSYFGTLPLWASHLAQSQPAIIEGHQRIRAIVFNEGHAARKLKELVFVCINSADRYGYGIDVHTKASANAGATQAEILEAMGVALLDGGIVTWIEGIHHYLGGGEKY